ncbi:2Fe-2S iron-sulfur cluster-binding protein [Lentzea sp. DG1S-22]|uniref:2Fe-2S iron-sulfur cluster-binding protein n=1 Tax=Lentzea sp. DG1S-22 TaxID=3108822 RepID=UPI002E7A7AE8|nr:2Fe-2S iron-sulfur cluster-binding protein [Lentzea sp. DG1S-22]WVH82720.1 2Fe-2S iron-sulfur cluster-binding protein [Lentzea sp. DG1S-22]
MTKENTAVPKVFYTQPDGTERVVEAEAGDSVMQAAVRNGVPGILAQCGGSLSCATCHVFLDERHADDFPPVSEDEDDMLDVAATDREDNSRLSCQLVLTEGQEVHVTIPETQL